MGGVNLTLLPGPETTSLGLKIKKASAEKPREETGKARTVSDFTNRLQAKGYIDNLARLLSNN